MASHVYRGWRPKDCNNDAFAPHSVPLALTATIAMDRQRRLPSLSVWVESGL